MQGACTAGRAGGFFPSLDHRAAFFPFAFVLKSLVMRIVSLLPSATEMLFALGFDREVVGVSHECDYPERAKTKKIVINSRIPHDASPLQIDTLVREYVSRGESLYSVDAGVL